jgi:hypothetical protein
MLVLDTRDVSRLATRVLVNKLRWRSCDEQTQFCGFDRLETSYQLGGRRIKMQKFGFRATDSPTSLHCNVFASSFLRRVSLCLYNRSVSGF